MKSRLYDCTVLHARSSPSRHRFQYRYFTFCLDLDEVAELDSRLRLFGLRRWNLFRFCAQDFIFGVAQSKGGGPMELKRRICDYVRDRGVTAQVHRVELVAHMRTLGYSFNPAAFYFCYSKDDQPIAAILEITNTYREKKAYLLGTEAFVDGIFQSDQSKLFYVSPFVDLDSSFDMRLKPPGETLRLQIDSNRDGSLQVHTLVTGRSTELKDLALLKRFLSHPLITLGVMAKIHYQALRIFLKKVPHIRKSDRMELQQGGLK